MFGYATSETDSLMPLPIDLAHRLAERLSAVRKDGTVAVPASRRQDPGHRPLRERPAGRDRANPDLDPARRGVDRDAQIRPDLLEHVILPALPDGMYDEAKIVESFLINPTGRFVIGGPVGDCGLTGRKIIVDTYGGMARHGGGAFSGKDPSKVDRSAAYAARHVAKNVVAAGLAERCEVQVAYAIGVAHPVSVMVETFGTEKIAPRADRRSRQRELRPAPRRLPRVPRPAQADLQAHGRLRPLRPRRLQLGEDRPCRCPEGRRVRWSRRVRPGPGGC